ncbi:SET domain-containing protein-lysine N-methyltransferase [Salmonella bongori]|uniref:SET domain-containing protein n=9 Tax=Salmonella bongori TaxID=54736 RepID=A0A0K0H9Z7_SALBC|nr:SET domain-containing protein-lysine N-methyltransferase [Salmonella bongori]ASG55046.1 SET domain-containing protein-lysine N-methyltransferase [Salmonella bongori serovar 66:z41:- str. SA19983605]CCC30177.1 hypothetical protein SBG_1082 [Salmonella bongori NCTC 12419]
MRGIGTIIPFRSLTGSDPEMPEFSGAWSSIKDYFPLHVQDEVALCFRVFYQPDEGVSALDRLKHFLRLKTLAFPGRQDSFTADRMHGTGETICAIASGSSSVFPSVTLSLSDQEWQSVQPQEEKADSSLSSVSEDSRETTATESTGTRPKGTPITNEQLQTWRDLPQEAKREAGGWKKWARAQGISTGSAGALLSNIGLTVRGEARIKSLENKGSPITETQLLMWLNMSPEERSEAGGWVTWVLAQGISMGSAGAYLSNAGLTLRGIERLHLPQNRSFPITNKQIQAWNDLTPEAKREVGGWVKWTQAQGISITSAQKYLTNSGLTSFGITRLQSPQEKGVPITRTHIQTWRDLPQEMKRETGGWVKWAQAQGIAISSAKKYLTNTGLTPYGKERLQSPGEKGSYITVTQLLAWFNMSPEARRETGGAKTWARTQGIAASSVRKYLTDSGLTSRGIERLRHDEDRGSTITDKQIQAWQDLPQEAKNEAGGWIAWAQTQGISISNARLYLTNSGLTFRGMTHLKSPEERGSVITKTQIQTWQDMSPAEKREAGGWIAWAQAQGISFTSAGVYLTHRGLTPRGISRLQSAKGRNASISNTQIQAWRDLPQEMKREAGGWTKWAQTQGISLWSAKNYLTNSGLTPRGAERLQSTEEKGTLITETQLLEWFNMSPTARHEAGGWMPWAKSQGISISNAYSYLTNNGLTRRGMERLHSTEERGVHITQGQLQAWLNMSPEARSEVGDWMTWAQTQGISIRSARKYLTNAGLTPFGMERLQSPEKRISRITKEQLQAWLNMSPEARSEVGDWRIWAQAQGISINSARKYLTNAGLTPLGMERLQPHEERGSAITKTQIRTWQKLSQEAKREAGGWRAWAQAQGISILNASTYLTNTGLTVIGMERLQPLKERGSPITEAQLLAWFSMSPEERRTSGGWATWAQAQGISYRSAKKYLTLTDSEIPSGRTRPSPSATVTSASQEASAAAGKEDVRMSTPSESIGDKRSLPWAEEDISAPQAKQIKKEEDAVTWRTHQIDNNLPILQHWRDPTVSVMEQAEGGKEALQVTLWGSLFNRLPRRIKVRINQDIQWFLQNEGNHDARMNDMMTVSIPLDDSDGYRGRTVYARTDLPAFTVLGPYSGRLLESETVRCEYEKEYGREASNYYFATRSQERIVSAWPQGNLLSLINNPVFGRRTAEAEARQNVSAVLVGKNITFYLTTRNISAGEELWFDYGADYQHFEAGKELRSGQIKEEPPSPEAEAV